MVTTEVQYAHAPRVQFEIFRYLTSPGRKLNKNSSSRYVILQCTKCLSSHSVILISMMCYTQHFWILHEVAM